MRKIIISFFVLLSVLSFSGVQAAGLLKNTTEMEGNAENISYTIFDENQSVSQIVATIISVFLSLLGIIFIILIIIAGFNWMTANGDEGKIEKAKKIMSRAIIGLIIIVSAYAVTKFVFTNLPSGGGSSVVQKNKA